MLLATKPFTVALPKHSPLLLLYTCSKLVLPPCTGNNRVNSRASGSSGYCLFSTKPHRSTTSGFNTTGYIDDTSPFASNSQCCKPKETWIILLPVF